MPKRIQLSRAKGWRMPEGAVKVDRTHPLFGNPFRMLENTPAERQRVIDLFARYFPMSAMRLGQARHDLKGKDLACWCPLDQPCHADVLIEIANNEKPDLRRFLIVGRA